LATVIPYDEETTMASDASGNCNCAECGESVPRGHTIMTHLAGRVCWFCYTDEYEDELEEGEALDDIDPGWDDWDD
jgi:hypothetical protein